MPFKSFLDPLAVSGLVIYLKDPGCLVGVHLRCLLRAQGVSVYRLGHNPLYVQIQSGTLTQHIIGDRPEYFRP